MSLVGVGTCTLQATQPGNAGYTAAVPAQVSYAVLASPQSIVFGPAPSLSYGGTATVSAVASSGLAVAFTSMTSTVCSVSGATVSGLAAGTCTIAANQSGNANYAPAPQVLLGFAVSPASQTINFAPIPRLSVGGTATLTATSSSGLAVTFSTTTPVICSVSGSTVTSFAAGTCTIAASQIGNANFASAAAVEQSVVVGRQHRDDDGVLIGQGDSPLVGKAAIQVSLTEKFERTPL